MPIFGSQINVRGKVFDIGRQHVDTIAELLELEVPKGYHTYCEEISKWMEYGGDDAEIDATFGKWKTAFGGSDDNSKYHIVDVLPPITINTNWVHHIGKRTEIIPSNKIFDIIPEGVVNESELEKSFEYPNERELIGFYINDNKAYEIDKWYNLNENEEETDVITILSEYEIDIVSNPNDSEKPEFLVRPDTNTEVAKNGHVYLTRKEITTTCKIYNGSSSQTYTAKVKVLTDISKYNIYEPVENPGSSSSSQSSANQGSSSQGSSSSGSSVVINPVAPDIIYNFIIYHNETNDEYIVYALYGDTLYPTDVNAVSSENQAPSGESYVLLKGLENSDKYDEYLFINGHYELLGTDYTIDLNDIRSSLAKILSDIDSRINDALAQSNNYPSALYDVFKCGFVKVWTIDDEYYYDYNDKLVLTNGLTKKKKTVELFDIDLSYLNSISFIDTDDRSYGLVCFDDPSTTTKNTIDVYKKTVYKSPHLIAGETYLEDCFTRYEKLYEIRNIDKDNETFDIYLVNTNGSTLEEEEDVSFSAITDNGEYDLAYYLNGRTADTVINDSPSQNLNNAFGNNPTQKDINEDLAITAFKLIKTFEQEAWIDVDADSRDSNNISKKFVPAPYVSSLNINDSDAFVIDNTVQALKSEAVEIAFAKPNMDSTEAEESTTWCYIGSSEPFTSISDGIDYAFAWKKDDPSDCIAWRSTDVEARPYNTHTSRYEGDGIKIVGYKIYDNIAGKLIKTLLNNN